MDFKDYVAIGSFLIALFGLFHMVIIAPMKAESAINRESISNLESNQTTLKVDHAVLATTMENIVKTLDKVVDKLESQSGKAEKENG